jgi:HEAT repeat protein
MLVERDKDDEDRPQRRKRDGDDDRPRSRERHADEVPPRRRPKNEGRGALGAKTAVGAVLTALVILLLLVRFIRVADKVDQARRDQRAREEASQRAASAPPAQKIPEFDANLANLKNNPNRFTVIYFCEQQVDPARQDAVARALEGCLKAQDQWVGYDACKALEKWGDKNSVQPLIDFYHARPDDVLRSRALEALGEIKDPAAAKALVGMIKSKAGNSHALGDCLRRVGPVGEKEVAALLDGDEDQVIEGCRVLQSIGTRASVPALNRVLENNQPEAKRKPNRAYKAADKAIRAINQRGQ